jgi:hypothetical protein
MKQSHFTFMSSYTLFSPLLKLILEKQRVSDGVDWIKLPVDAASKIIGVRQDTQG